VARTHWAARDGPSHSLIIEGGKKTERQKDRKTERGVPVGAQSHREMSSKPCLFSGHSSINYDALRKHQDGPGTPGSLETRSLGVWDQTACGLHVDCMWLLPCPPLLASFAPALPATRRRNTRQHSFSRVKMCNVAQASLLSPLLPPSSSSSSSPSPSPSPPPSLVPCPALMHRKPTRCLMLDA